MQIRIIRQQRKSIRATINREGIAEVRVPHFLSDKEIQDFVDQHMEALEKIKARRADPEAPIRHLLYKGEEKPATPWEKPIVFFDGETFYLPELAFSSLRKPLIRLYKQLAENMIRPRVMHFGRLIGVYPAVIKIGSGILAWGSCSSEGTLSFSCFLAMASPGALDYVVIHELCHMRWFDHSKSFWALVERYSPNYEQFKQELQQLSERLCRENWK